jgi:hypothetical protein
MSKIAKMPLSNKEKEFQKIKKFVIKRAPSAHTIKKPDGSYVVVDGGGRAVQNPELFLPKAGTVRKAWEQAKYSLWFSNMIAKSNAAFNEEKMFKQLRKEHGDN